MTNRYIHGSEPKEQRRLSLLNQLLNRTCLRELALGGNESVLDLGSGVGQFTRDIARIVAPRGRVLGIERDKQQLIEARRQAQQAGETNSVEWRRGDALKLPLEKREWGSFDLAHARFVLEHLKEPQSAVRQMVCAVRRGGRVVLADDDHDTLRLWPEVPGFVDLWQAYIRAYSHLGCDPFIGRRLVSLLHDAGAKPHHHHALAQLQHQTIRPDLARHSALGPPSRCRHLVRPLLGGSRPRREVISPSMETKQVTARFPSSPVALLPLRLQID